MDLDRLVALLAGEISGVRAKQRVEELTRFHRIQASPGYNEALEHVQGLLEEAGVESKVHAYPADGKSKTYEWTAPPAWTVRSGSLRQIEPKKRGLVSFDEVPQSVVAHSPGGGFEGELIHVGTGMADGDYTKADVRGKFALASGRASEVEKRAGERGAVGVVIYPDSERAAADYNLVQYQSIFPRAEAIADLVPAFSISRRQADDLLKALERGTVRLAGKIDAEFVEGELRVLEAFVRGEDPDAGEAVLVAHICHPRQSANDNASGSGLLVELARALQALRGDIGLRHTVRFVWVPEFYGTLPWSVGHTEELRRAYHVLNLDMVGQSPDLIGEPLRISRVPNATPSYLNACIPQIAARVAALAVTAPGGSSRSLHWLFEVPCGGSDHLVFGAAPHRLPAVMIHHNDPYWHTSSDTLEKVDPTRLEEVGILAGALALLPLAAAESGPLMLEWLLEYGVRAIARASGLARQLDLRRGRRLLEIALRIEEDRLDDMSAAIPGGVEQPCLDRHKVALRGACKHALGLLTDEGAAAGPAVAGQRPRQIIDGPLVYAVTERLDEEETAFFDEKLSAEHRAVAQSLLGLCDGTRSVEEIGLQMMLEFDRVLSMDDIERGIALLVKTGYVER